MRPFVAVIVLLSALAAAPAGAEPGAAPGARPVAKGIVAMPPGAAQFERADYMLLGLGGLALLLFLVDLSRKE
jgi:hypothetical protein